MMIPAQNLDAWKISISILHCTAIVSTILRIWQRKQTNGVWWDDYFAIVSMLMTVVQIVVIWLLFVPTAPQASVVIALYWILAFSWFTLIWLCRISLALSIARIFPSWASPRQYSLGLALCFSIIYVGLLSWQATLHCVSDAHQEAFLHCGVDQTNLAIFSITSDIIADVLLVASPFYMLWRIRLPTAQRRLVLTLFSASALTLAVAIVFAICTFSPWVKGPGAYFITSMVSQLEAAISLIVCNLLVVVTFFLRILKKERHNPENIIDDKVTCTLPPAGGRKEGRAMSVTIITLTEIAQDGSGKFPRDDNVSYGGKWYPSHMFANFKLNKDNDV